MHRNILVALALLLAAAVCVPAAETLVVFADDAFGATLETALPRFEERTGTPARAVYGSSADLVAKLRAGESADLFLPAGEEYMRQAMDMGLIDIALKRNVVSLERREPAEGQPPEDLRYTSAAVLANAPSRLQAMMLLEFLTSEEARGIFADHGFSLP
jgi:ABC-type molybdate transport system substrate-binding protein